MKKWFASILLLSLVGLISGVAYAASPHESVVKKTEVGYFIKSELDVTVYEFFHFEKPGFNSFIPKKENEKSGNDQKFVCQAHVRTDFSPHYARLCISPSLPNIYDNIKYKFRYLITPPCALRS